eukprot:gene10716-11864_t
MLFKGLVSSYENFLIGGWEETFLLNASTTEDSTKFYGHDFIIKVTTDAFLTSEQWKDDISDVSLRECHKYVCPDLPLGDFSYEYKEIASLEDLQNLGTA